MSAARIIDSNNFGDGTQIHQGDVIHNHASNTHKPCALIPFPRNEELIPRPEIISKLDELLPLSEEFFATALYGLGGSGKTQIALDYAYRRSQAPKCSVFWVHADNETTFIQDFKLMAKKLGLPGNPDGDDLLTAVRYHIEANPPWVFILDNADNLTLFGVGHSAQDAVNLGEHALRLDNFIPRGPGGQVLWTSRDERISGSLVGARRAIKVSNMTSDEARELFDSVRNKQVSRDEAEAITALLAELDWLPLAISQAAAYIKKTMLTVEQYILRLKEGKKRWKILKQSQTDRHRRREVSNSILETWNISMKYLQTENPKSYQILHIHAFLDNQNIPVELIQQAALYNDESNVMDHDHETHDDDSSSDSDIEGDSINEAITRLRDFSFLSIQATEDGNRAYKVHKLVQEAMRYGLSRKEREIEEKYFSAAALDIVFKLFPKSEPKVWSKCEKYITHAQQACEWAALCGKELKAASLFAKLSDYLFDRGRWREREIVDQRAYEIRKTTLGDNHTNTITSLARLAVTYHELGRYKEAEEINVKVLALRRKILGDRHPRTVWSMERLGVTYHQLSRHKEAEELQWEALALRREILGKNHPDTIKSMADLAATYSKLGRDEEAKHIKVKVLALRREILGGKHPDTIWSMKSLGVTYSDLGRYKEAEEMQVKALALWREILGDKHPDTINSMADLAATYYSLNKYEEGERLSTEALALRREILGDNHPNTIRNMKNLAVIYRALGRDEEAYELEMEVLELQGS
ncbi:P-loop containing nucleoside triphosphate hydrolase protein [Trichoderma evansii]